MPEVSRRSFLKSTARVVGLGLLPTFKILFPSPIPNIDLQQFCDTGFRRYDIGSPFQQEGLTYATDARVCVRTNLIAVAEAGKEIRLPPASSVFRNRPSANDLWKPWPKKSFVSTSDGGLDVCPVCDGIGRIGIGIVDCPACEDDVDCDNCNSSGFVGGEKCDYCDGSGITNRPSQQPIGDLRIAGKYYRKIATLPNVEFSLARECPMAEPSLIIPFRFDGGEGCVMPVADVPRR